jgi:hypothetical protein
MIEFLVLYHLWGRVADHVYARGYERPLGLQVLLLVAWFGGEMVGATTGILAGGVPPDAGGMFIVYLCALASGAAGAVIVFLVVRAMPKREIPGEEDLVWLRKR